MQFPLWTRVACTFCLILGSWGFTRSIRQTRGIHALQEGRVAFKENRIKNSAESLHLARMFMPDDESVEDLAAFYKGSACLEEQNFQEAVHWFQVFFNLDPGSKVTARMLYISQRLDAFKSKQMDAYFRASLSLLELEDNSPETLLAMAPAWAWKFAATGTEENRQQALKCLKDAHDAGGSDADDWIIEGWVNQILETRTIISLNDFRSALGKTATSDEDSG